MKTLQLRLLKLVSGVYAIFGFILLIISVLIPICNIFYNPNIFLNLIIAKQLCPLRKKPCSIYLQYETVGRVPRVINLKIINYV